MRDKDLVESREIEQSGRPNRIIHTITKAGEDVVHAWSLKPCRMPSVKDELLVKLYALDNVDIPVLHEQLDIRLDQHRAKLTAYLRIKEKFYDGKKLTRAQKGKLIALTMGISNEREMVGALGKAITMLGEINE